METPDKRIAFQYLSEWQKNGFSISPFSLPLRNDVFVPNERSLERFGGLFGVFADSLPDSWGQLLLDRHLETLGITRSGISTL
jgi:serine/threonine-protein kinase HipA